MMYFAFFSFFAFASVMDLTSDNLPVKKMMWYFIFAFLLYFVGLRYYTGSDWAWYINYFNSVTLKDNRTDAGYKILNLIIKSMFNSYYAVQFVSTFIFLFSIARFFTLYSEHKFTALFIALCLYFSSLFMSQVRQSLAVSVLLLGTSFLFEKKWIRWLITVCVASLFHVTALVAVLAPLLFIPFSRRSRVLIFIAGILITLYPSWVTGFLQVLSNFLHGALGDKIRTYLASAYFSSKIEFASGLYFYSKQILALIIILLFTPKTRTECFMLNALVVALFISDMAVGFSVLDRMSDYVGFYAIVGWTYFLDIKALRTYKSVFYLSLLCFVLFFLFPKKDFITDTDIPEQLTGRPYNYRYIPYWNVLNHPDGAFRYDWNEH